MARKKAEVAVTCNITQAKQAQKILITALEALQKKYELLVSKGKENEAETQKLKATMEGMASAVTTNEQNMNRIKAVMDNLSGATLKQLNAALREVKRQMSGKSTESTGLDDLRAKYQAITEQIKVLKGETVNISKGIQNLSSQSDAWLAKAIAKQKELVAQTREGTQAYSAQTRTLARLEAEQRTRSLSAIRTKGNAAMAVAMAPAHATMTQLRDARQNLVNYRDSIGVGGNNLGSAGQNANAIKQINELLKAIDKQIDTINGKEQKVAMSAQQIAQSVKQIDFAKATPNELKAKLDEVNNALANMGKNDPMRGRLIQSAKQLQQALASMSGEAVNVKSVLANLDSASPQKLKAALNQVNRSLETMGQNNRGRKALLQQAKQLQEALAKVDKEAVNINRVLGNLKKASLEDLKKAAAQLEREMSKCDRSTKEYLSKRNQFRQLKREIDKVNGSVSRQEGAWKKTLSAITAYMGVTMLIGRLISMLSNLIKLNLKLSDQLADIRKVSGLAIEDVNNLSKRLADLDTRTTIQELNSIAYAGAKLGIGKFGVDGLEGFVRAANQVNVALKEDLGADALTALSKITEVMGLLPTMGVERSMLATGSAMFKLSASSTATAGNIVEFSKRLTGMARTAGITTDQLLALGSAADSMYLMPEVASTAFNKFISSLQTKHNLIEKELSIEPGTISKLYSAGKIVDAMVLVFEKMREKGNMNALQGVFKDLGSEGARLVNVMVTMSKNVDILKEHLYISKEAFEQASAVTDEYNIQQETAQALMERASNIWEKAFVNPDGVDNVKGLAQAWYDASRSFTANNTVMAQLKLLLGMILVSVKALLPLLPTLIQFFLFKGAAVAVVALVGGMRSLCTATLAAVRAQNALNAAQSSNLFGLVATAVALLVTHLIACADKTDELAESQKNLSEAYREAISMYAKEVATIDNYIKALSNKNIADSERERLLAKFNRTYKTYIDQLGVEIKSVDDLREHYTELNKAIRQKMLYQMRERAYQERLNTDKDGKPSLITRLSSSISEYADALSAYENGAYSAYDVSYLLSVYEKVVAERAEADNKRKANNAATKSAADEWRQSAEYYEIMNREGYNAAEAAVKKRFVEEAPPPAQPERSILNEAMDRIESDLSLSGVGVDDNGWDLAVKMKHVLQAYEAYLEEKKRIDDTFGSDFADLFVADEIGSLDNEAPDKDAMREAQQAADRQKHAYKEEIKQLQGQVTGIIDNLKNFYTRQAAIVTEFANEAGWDPALLDNTLDIIEQQRDFALAEARKAIAGIPNQWDQVLANLEADMAEMDRVIGKDDKGKEWVYNASRELIDKLRAADPEAIRNRLGFLDRALGATDGTSLAEVWNKASENEKHRLTAEQRRQREYQQYLLQHNYRQKVDSDYTASMTRLGYFDIDLAQSETLLNGSSASSTPEEKAAADKIIKDRMEAIQTVLTSSVKNYVDLLTIGDVSTAEGRNRFLSLIFGENYDESAIVLRGIVESNGAELQVFYDQILKYVDDYTEATKKAEERTKKLADFQWNHSGIKANLDAAEANNDLYKKGLLQHRRPDEAEKRPDYGVYGNTRFVSDFGVDPEIEAYRLKIEAAKAYYDFLRAHGMKDEQLREQQKAVAEAQAAYVEKLTSRIKKQMDALLGMHAPIENFGTKAGEAFALMTEDAEAGRKALKAAVGDMINDFMKQTVEMTKEYIKRRLMQKIHDRLTSVEAAAHEAELTQIQSTGDTARLVHHETVQTNLTAIDKTQATERETTVQEEVVEEVGTEAAGTGAKVSLGIAGGAAKTIGALGWWGIPLVAVISMLLNGLLSFAMSKVSSLFGGKTASDSGAQTKLVSGMLTYDSGNVQAFRGVEDGKTYPVVGSDGKVYAAKDGGELSTGLVEDPITTLVNGQPALVAERGPEMVIGRETTAAMMMARPDILAEIVKFDRQRSGRTYRAYDSGNIDALQFSVPDGSAVGSEDMAQLRETINALTLVLSALQRDGIPAHINKYGRGGVAESARSGGKFMQRNSGDPLWRS